MDKNVSLVDDSTLDAEWQAILDGAKKLAEEEADGLTKFDEAEHPRDENGEFTDKGAGAGEKTFSAAVRNNKDGETSVINSKYKSKQEFRQDLNRNGYSVVGRVTEEEPKEQAAPAAQELDYDQKYDWATKVVTGELAGKIKNNELLTDMQSCAMGDETEEEFTSHFSASAEQDTLPKAKKPTSDDSGWMFHTDSGKMPPEMMYFFQQHYKKNGDGSQIILPSELREYSNGVLDEQTLSGIYSKNLDGKYFQWERSGGLNQLRLKNKYKFSAAGIASVEESRLKALKDAGMTPKRLYKEIQKLRPTAKAES